MMSSCAFSCTKCSEGYPNQLRSKAERKSAWWKRQHPKPLDFRKITHDIHGKPLIKPNIESDDPVVQAKAARALATMHRTSAHPSPSPLASPSPAPKPHKTFEEKLDDKYKKNTFGFDVHVLACSRPIDTLLEQLSAATCNSAARQELFIHIDRCGNKAVYNAAHDYKWPCGPTTVTNKPVKRGMREMWFDTWELVQERHEKNGEVCCRPSAPGPCARTRFAGSHRCVPSAVADRGACPRGRYVDLASLRHVPRAGDGHGEQHVFCRWCLALANPHGRDGHASEALGGI